MAKNTGDKRVRRRLMVRFLMAALLAAPGLAAGGCRPNVEAPPFVLAPRGEKNDPTAFQETSRDAGLAEFRWAAPKPSPLNILDTAMGGAGFLDFDGDGVLDIVLIGRRIALFRGDGHGRFRDVSAARSGLTATGALMGCAVGDYDNDGRSDLFVTGHGVARLYRNRGGGTFQDVTGPAGVGPRAGYDWSTSAGFADLDNDGLLDLVVGHYVLFEPRARQVCDYPAAGGDDGGQKQGERVRAACPPFYYEAQHVRIFRNRGDGTFADQSVRLPASHGNTLGIGIADFDDDGRPDIYVANDGMPADLYRNRGSFRFDNTGTQSGTAFNRDGGEQAGMGVDWGDYDNDGRLDLLVTTFQDEPKSLYHNEGDGLFSYASYAAGIGGATRARLAFGGGFLDYDNDGNLDLLLANGHVQDTIARMRTGVTYAQPMQLFQGRGDGTFADVTEGAGGAALLRPIVGRAVAFGDYDNDGRMDALVADLNGSPRLLHNQSQARNHWLGVRPVSRFHGRPAIGARVTLDLGNGVRRIAESQTCRSYLSAGDARVHFGLGPEQTRVPRLSVRWPGGATTVRENVPADQYVTIVEPGSPAP